MLELRHPNIVLYMGASIQAPNLAIVTELMERGSLYDVIHKRALDIKLATKVQFARDSLRGLSFLHQSNMVHRDMKSLNILVSRTWVAKVSDFGLSAVKSECEKQGGEEGGTPGSVFWTAPEVLDGQYGKAKYGPPADVYSFGIVLWEVHARRLPFTDVVVKNHFQLTALIAEGRRPVLPPGTPAPSPDDAHPGGSAGW